MNIEHGYKTVMDKFRIEIRRKFLIIGRLRFRTGLSIRVIEERSLAGFKMELKERYAV